MNTTDLVHGFLADAPSRRVPARHSIAPSRHELVMPVRASIFHSRCYLEREQRLDGSWAGTRAGDVSSLSQFVLLSEYLGRGESELVRQAVSAILSDARPEGGWAQMPGGEVDLNVSILAYFALKLSGEEATQLQMRNARQAIRELGGADAANDNTRWWLALLGQVDYDVCPEISAEWLLATRFQGHTSAVRERRLAAMAVIAAKQPRRIVDVARGVRELFVEPSATWPQKLSEFAPQCSSAIGELWSRCERVGLVPFRKRALERAKFLLTESAIETGCHDADITELVWHWIALSSMGFSGSSPAIAACEGCLNRLVFVDAISDEARSQPDTSLTADTALVVEALRASGVGLGEPPVSAGVRWLVDHRLQQVAAQRNDRERAAVLRAIAPTIHCAGGDYSLPPVLRVAENSQFETSSVSPSDEVVTQSMNSVAATMVEGFIYRQHFDGGWSPWQGADDVSGSGVVRWSQRRALQPSSPESTGATLALLAERGLPVSHRALCGGVAYLRKTQRGDGSWDSATGARFIHGTTWAIRGLIAAGVAVDDPTVAAGLNWLVVHQQESGGWGETTMPQSAARDYIQADATAVQTAWAVLAFVAAGQADHPATRRAVAWLIEVQSNDGNWSDTLLSVRESEAGSWYRNELHSAALPLLALSKWAVAIGDVGEASETPALRLVCSESLN